MYWGMMYISGVAFGIGQNGIYLKIIMQYLLSVFWAICLFKKKPEDLPYSVALFWLLLISALILDTLTLSLSVPSVDFGTVLLTVTVHQAVSLGALAGLLGLLGYSTRINKTLNSFLGTGLVISLLAIPPLLLLRPANEPAGPAAIMLVVLNIWSLMITAHILRHALSVNPVISAVLAVGFFMLSVGLMNALLPETA